MVKSIIPGDRDDRCYLCHRQGVPLARHHCLHGSRRKFADKYGLTVHLCVKCHMLLHDTGEHDRELEALGQAAFETLYGHKEFMRQSGKSYYAGARRAHWREDGGMLVCSACGYETEYIEALCPKCGRYMGIIIIPEEVVDAED